MSAGDKFQFDEINYTIIDRNTCQVGFGYAQEPYTSAVSRTYSKNISIPRYAIKDNKEYLVTVISKHAFYACAYIEVIIVPNCVTELCQSCFGHMTSLKEVIIQDTSQIKKIGFSFILGHPKLKEFYIPSSVKYLDVGAFYGYPYSTVKTIYCGQRKFNVQFLYEAVNVTIHVSKQYRYSSFGNIKIVKDATCDTFLCPTINARKKSYISNSLLLMSILILK